MSAASDVEANAAETPATAKIAVFIKYLYITQSKALKTRRQAADPLAVAAEIAYCLRLRYAAKPSANAPKTAAHSAGSGIDEVR